MNRRINYTLVAESARSFTIELDNDYVYENNVTYDVLVNNKVVIQNEKKNVISIFGLLPNREYDIEVKTEYESCLKSMKTLKESVRLNVARFGAKGDGESLDSTAIQAAILSCPKDGTVYIPGGVYYCEPLFLKSNITIELEEGAVLLGHTDRELYPILPGYTVTSDEKDEYYLGSWEGNPLDCFASLITGIGVENVSIIGKGIIDGNGSNGDWWIDPKVKKTAWRPRTIFLNNCKNILVQGITVTNSPSWTVHPFFSDNLTFTDLTIKNHMDSPNTDGLDPDSCTNVSIIGVYFSVGDDCIAIKSGKLYMGMKSNRPSRNLYIRNCLMEHGHGAVVMGSEMSGGIKEVEVSQCLFRKTDRGLRIKTRRGRGENGIIDDIRFENIRMEKVLSPFVINMFYFCDPDGKSSYVWSRKKLPVDQWTPYLGRFLFKDIICIDSEVASAYFLGLPEQPIEEITLDQVVISFSEKARLGQPAMMSFADFVCKQGIIAEYIKQLTLNNVSISGIQGEELVMRDVENVINSKELPNG